MKKMLPEPHPYPSPRGGTPQAPPRREPDVQTAVPLPGAPKKPQPIKDHEEKGR